MPRIDTCVLLVPGLVLLAASSGSATSAIDEALGEAGAQRAGAAAEATLPRATALPDVAAPRPEAATSYGEILAEPGDLAAALRALPAPSRPLRVFLDGSGSELVESGDAGAFSLDAPLPEAWDPELAPVELGPELGLPAPVDLGPR